MNVKNALFIFFVFFVSFFLSLIVLTIVQVAYVSVSGMQAGVLLTPINYTSVLYTCVNTISYAAILSLVLLFFFFIRHPMQKIENAVSWFCLSMLTWLIIIPFSFEITERISPAQADSVAVPSPKYFRPYAGSIYYWLENEPDSAKSGVSLTFNGQFSLENGIIHFFEEKKDAEADTIFQKGQGDMLIQEQLTMPSFLKSFTASIYVMSKRLFEAYQKDFFSYALIASFGISLAALWVFTCLTHWRLLNVLLVICGFYLIIYINTQIYTAGFMLFAGEFIVNFISADFLPLVVNVLFAGIVSLIGFFVLFVRSFKKKGAER